MGSSSFPRAFCERPGMLTAMPSGPRTLCNACGLVYAKLVRDARALTNFSQRLANTMDAAVPVS